MKGWLGGGRAFERIYAVVYDYGVGVGKRYREDWVFFLGRGFTGILQLFVVACHDIQSLDRARETLLHERITKQKISTCARQHCM